MAYHPPEGDALVLTSTCYLIWLPDDQRYRAAFWGAYTDMALPWLWETNDPAVKEAIERSWNEAIWQTLGCMDMSCLESIIDRLQAIESAIYLTSCCGVDAPGTPRTSDIIPGVGDAPALWGGEAVSDWDDYNDLLCGAAHSYVDRLIDAAVDAQEAIENSAVLLGAVALLLSLLSGAGIILGVGYAAAAGAAGGLLLLVGSGAFDDLAADIEAARADITCAIVSGGDLASAVAQAVGSVAWDALYRFADYDSAHATLLNGGADGQSLPVDRTQACPCDVPDYFVRVLFGTYLGNGVWESTVGDRATVQLELYEDSSLANKIEGTVQLSADSVYGTRLLTGSTKTYRLLSDSLAVLYNNTVYPAAPVTGVHRITVQHTGSTPFTINIAITDVVV